MGVCPDNYYRCSDDTSGDNTVCSRKFSDCPILDIKIIEDAQRMASWNSQSPVRNSEQVSGYTYKRYYDNKFVTFTKNAAGVDNLPITTVKMGDTSPCADPLEQANGQVIAYPTEMMQGGCSFDEFAQNEYDERYRSTGLSDSEYEVQLNNAVLDILMALPNYQSEVPNFYDKGNIVYTGY
jgi:hypothetical protein